MSGITDGQLPADADLQVEETEPDNTETDTPENDESKTHDH